LQDIRGKAVLMGVGRLACAKGSEMHSLQGLCVVCLRLRVSWRER